MLIVKMLISHAHMLRCSYSYHMTPSQSTARYLPMRNNVFYMNVHSSLHNSQKLEKNPRVCEQVSG